MRRTGGELGSLDSVVPSDEEGLERRGSLPFFTNRRGSRLSDIIQFQVLLYDSASRLKKCEKKKQKIADFIIL